MKLISIILTIALLMACQTKKQATATTKEQLDIEAAGSVSTSTAERFQWLSRMCLDIDSFELVMTTGHFAEIGKMMNDTAMYLHEQFAQGLGHPCSGSVVLRGKHARLGKDDIVQSNAARRAEQVDTLSAHRSIDKADHYARDTVGIAKPPDVTWWPWLMLAVILMGIAIYTHNRK